METHVAIQKRQSIRAYLDRPVPQLLIEKLLNLARHAPSGANTQPWHVAVVTGETKVKLAVTIQEAFESGVESVKDYQYYPLDWIEPYKNRRVACGIQLYEALGIERRDKEKRKTQWAANYRSFDAPVMLFFLLDRKMQTGSFMDLGMFLQNIMLAAVEEGLGTCPQAALAEYPDIVRQVLGYDHEMMVVCGMALGYPDMTQAVNQYRTPRDKPGLFAKYFE